MWLSEGRRHACLGTEGMVMWEQKRWFCGDRRDGCVWDRRDGYVATEGFVVCTCDCVGIEGMDVWGKKVGCVGTESMVVLGQKARR